MNQQIKYFLGILLVVFAIISFGEMVYNTHLFAAAISEIKANAVALNSIGYGIMFLFCIIGAATIFEEYD